MEIFEIKHDAVGRVYWTSEDRRIHWASAREDGDKFISTATWLDGEHAKAAFDRNEVAFQTGSNPGQSS